MHAGNRLRVALKEINLRPTQLAEEIGVTYENIRYYYTQTKFSRVIISNIRAALEKRGVNIKHFLNEDEPLLSLDDKGDLDKIYRVLTRIEIILDKMYERLIPEDT